MKSKYDGTCAVPGCERAARKYKAYCSSHQGRFDRHGDPLAGRVTNGEPIAWLERHKNYQGDDCLIWPFGRLSNGYGTLHFEGKASTASRVMCQIAHGAAPAGKYEAAHSCRGAKDGCVNPKHLRWATVSENQLDRVRDDTHARGGRHHFAKLTESDVKSIRGLRASHSQQKLADMYGVHRSTVVDVLRGRTWHWL